MDLAFAFLDWKHRDNRKASICRCTQAQVAAFAWGKCQKLQNVWCLRWRPPHHFVQYQIKYPYETTLQCTEGNHLIEQVQLHLILGFVLYIVMDVESLSLTNFCFCCAS